MATPMPGIPVQPPDRADPRETYYFDLLVKRRVADTAAIPWTAVDKTGSSLADLATRLHAALQTLTADDHVNYVHISVARTISVTHTFSAKQYFGDEIEVDGALNHDGTTVGFYGTAPATQASAAADLTGSASGTVNGSIQSLTDPADAPASADALRDDLVANIIPELRNNIDELRVKVNAALTALRGVGLIAT